MANKFNSTRSWVCSQLPCFALVLVACGALSLVPNTANAQNSSISAWDAADFRVWGYIPYWATSTQITNFATNGMYGHVSDVIYFGGVRPTATGGLVTTSTGAQHLSILKNQVTSSGIRLHMSMFEVSGGTTNDVWNSIIANPTYRANFVTNVKTLLQNNNMQGFNFDWERPATDQQWGDYTQLARELRATINPLGMEVSVCDYGSTDSDWDDTALFDAKVYDQLMMMSYHLTASSSGSYANTKLALTGQGAAKAFSNDQVAVGFGTWGVGVDPDGTGPLTKPGTVSLQSIVTANPNLPYDALTFTGTINGVTGTWSIESRKQIREKTQLALDRNMPGTFSWTLHYDATNNLGLHRVTQHYVAVKRNVPDLNLDGKVNATDATALVNQMGTSLTNTGITTAAQFDAFYLNGNWEKGDRDGNGFVNQADADWLAGRFTTLGVNLPDRLAFSGTFENHSSSVGVNGRWRAGRNALNQLSETGNLTQRGANYLSFTGTGAGASKRSNSFVTLRNQNTAETTAGINTAARVMEADLTTPIDLAQDTSTYFTFVVRETTSSLSAAQLASPNRTLALEFLDTSKTNQFDFALRGLQQDVSIRSQADGTGQDVTGAGFSPDTTYMFVGKISGNGYGANTLQASWFANGSSVGKFTDAAFPWMLTANSSAAFNPLLTQVRFSSLFEANYTVSNLWIGDAEAFFPLPAPSTGDFDGNGTVDAADFVMWRTTLGQTGTGLRADGNGNGIVDTDDLLVWRARFGQTTGSGAGFDVIAVPEPTTLLLLTSALAFLISSTGRRPVAL